MVAARRRLQPLLGALITSAPEPPRARLRALRRSAEVNAPARGPSRRRGLSPSSSPAREAAPAGRRAPPRPCPSAGRRKRRSAPPPLPRQPPSCRGGHRSPAALPPHSSVAPLPCQPGRAAGPAAWALHRTPPQPDPGRAAGPGRTAPALPRRHPLTRSPSRRSAPWEAATAPRPLPAGAQALAVWPHGQWGAARPPRRPPSLAAAPRPCSAAAASRPLGQVRPPRPAPLGTARTGTASPRRRDPPSAAVRAAPRAAPGTAIVCAPPAAPSLSPRPPSARAAARPAPRAGWAPRDRRLLPSAQPLLAPCSTKKEVSTPAPAPSGAPGPRQPRRAQEGGCTLSGTRAQAEWSRPGRRREPQPLVALSGTSQSKCLRAVCRYSLTRTK